MPDLVFQCHSHNGPLLEPPFEQYSTLFNSGSNTRELEDFRLINVTELMVGQDHKRA